jgi:hypothetical protein
MGTKCKTFTKFGHYNKYGTKEYETGDTRKEERKGWELIKIEQNKPITLAARSKA